MKGNRVALKSMVVCLALVLAASAAATEVSAPLNAGDPAYRELRWADDLGLLNSSLPGHRPLSRKAVFNLLRPTRGSQAPELELSPAMVRRIRAAGTYLVPWELFWDKGVYPVMVGGSWLQRLAVAGSGLTGGDSAPEPWNFGETYDDGLRATAAGSFFMEGDWLALSYGYRMIGSRQEDVALRTLELEARWGWKNARLTVGREPLWWSNSDHGALLLSTNARPLDQIRLESDTPWNTPVGNFHAAGFVAHLDDPDRNDYPDPWLGGLRATWAPSPWFTLGATRAVMLGGKGNPFVVTWRSLWDLLVVGNENRKDVEDLGNDTDQLASVEATLYLWPLFRRLPVLQGGRLYAERGGEDSPQGEHNGVFPSAPAWNVGVELIAAGVFLRGEASTNVDDSNVWYWHRRYRDGFRYRGRILGHAMGSDAHAYSLETEIPLRGGRDVATVGWYQWDRGHEALRGVPSPNTDGPVPRGIMDRFLARYELGLGPYPGHVALEARTRAFRGDKTLFGDQEEWGVTLSWRR